MLLLVPAAIWIVLSQVVPATSELHPLSNEFIDLINSKQNTWIAGRNFHPDISLEYIKGLLGVALDRNPKIVIPVKKYDAVTIANLPESFDPRDKWPNCPELNEIRDQGHCGSCWAHGTAEAMTDRVCVYSNGTKHFRYSSQDILTCSGWGSCDGGYPEWVFQRWEDTGFVSGGDYDSNEGCLPYTIPPCDHTILVDNKPNCSQNYVKTPECKRTCNLDYGNTYEKDRRRGRNIRKLDNARDMMAEVYNNGPISVQFTVYGDFFNYKSGVYIRNDELEMLGYHEVKLLGWGVEKGVKYWLVANSWNTNWGDRGFFKILRGENHCHIESNGLAGDPILNF